MNVDKYIDIPNENVEESKRSKLENYKTQGNVLTSKYFWKNGN